MNFSTISRVIYHIPQAFTTADYKFSIISCKCRGLWKFQFVANYLRFFQPFFVKVFAKVGWEILCFFGTKRRIWLYCAVCFCNSLLSKSLHKNQYIKVADLCIAENFQRLLFKHTLFERLCHSLLREQQRNGFAVNLCRIARLRVAAQLFRLRDTTP